MSHKGYFGDIFLEYETGGLLTDQAEFSRSGDGLSAAVDVQLAINILDVVFDGPYSNIKGLSDFGVGIAGSDKLHNFHFALAERLYKFTGVSWWLGGSRLASRECCQQVACVYRVLPAGSGFIEKAGHRLALVQEDADVAFRFRQGKRSFQGE